MKKGLIVINDNFEETECLLTRDILKRAGIGVQILTLGDSEMIRSTTNLIIKSDLNSNFRNFDSFDFLLITGGVWVIDFLNSASVEKREYLSRLIKHFTTHNKLIGAICAAPLLLYDCDVLPDNFTCFPACGKNLKHAPQTDGVIIEKNIITAKALGYSFEFSFAVVEKLLGKDTLLKIQNEIYYKK